VRSAWYVPWLSFKIGLALFVIFAMIEAKQKGVVIFMVTIAVSIVFYVVPRLEQTLLNPRIFFGRLLCVIPVSACLNVGLCS